MIASWEARALMAVSQGINDCQEGIERSKKYFNDRQFESEYYQRIIRESEHTLAALQNWQLGSPGEKSVLQIDKTWECAIMSGKYVIGFIDMRVIHSSPVLWVKGIKQYGGKGWVLEDYHEEMPSWETSIGYQEAIYFEVKTAIPSLGELIRQIRMYQEYISGAFYVVAPDAQYKDMLRSQGIDFIHYPSGISG